MTLDEIVPVHKISASRGVLIGIVGAFVGALLSFGDAPFLMRHPYLNPWTLSVLGAVLLVTVLGVVDENVFRRSRHAHLGGHLKTGH